MQNYFLRHFREAKKLAPKEVAAKLGIRPIEYLEIEKGDVLMEYEQAEKLSKFFKIKTSYLYQICLGIDQFHKNEEEIRRLQSEVLNKQIPLLEKYKQELTIVKSS